MPQNQLSNSQIKKMTKRENSRLISNEHGDLVTEKAMKKAQKKAAKKASKRPIAKSY